MAKNRLNLRVSEDTRERLRTIALELGLKSEHGLSAGDGNISGLLDAIANGNITLVSSWKAVSLEQAEAKLKNLAKRLGYVVKTGPYAHEGNLSAFLADLDARRFVFVPADLVDQFHEVMGWELPEQIMTKHELEAWKTAKEQADNEPWLEDLATKLAPILLKKLKQGEFPDVALEHSTAEALDEENKGSSSVLDNFTRWVTSTE